MSLEKVEAVLARVQQFAECGDDDGHRQLLPEIVEGYPAPAGARREGLQSLKAALLVALTRPAGHTRDADSDQRQRAAVVPISGQH